MTMISLNAAKVTDFGQMEEMQWLIIMFTKDALSTTTIKHFL